jgi:PAS domain S-box-containing protein
MNQVRSAGGVHQFLGSKDILSSWSGSSLALLKWFVDGTLVFAVSDEHSGSADFREGLAKHFKKQFQDSPSLVVAISRAFEGEHVTQTVPIHDGHWDVRLFPTYSGGKMGGVVGILTDATDRISAGRSLNAIDILFTIRHHLARANEVDEFLHKCCEAIEEHYPRIVVALAERADGKRLRVYAGAAASALGTQPGGLSWDVGQNNGRNALGEAIRTGKIQRARPGDAAVSRNGDAWLDPQASAALVVPLLSDASSVGALAVFGADDSIFANDVVNLFEKIAAEVTEGINILGARADRVQIVRARQGDQLKYEQLVNSIFDVILVHSGGKIISLNQVGVRLTRAQSASQIEGTPILALIDPADRARFKASLQEPVNSASLLEFRLLTLDGETIEVEGLTVPTLHENEPAQLSVWRDISARKQSERLISKQNTSLEYAQQVAQIGSIEIELSSGRAEWSKSASEMLGVESEALEKKFLSALTGALGEKEVGAVADLLESIRTSRKEQRANISLRRGIDGGAPAQTLQFHGIPQLEDRVNVTRVFFVVQNTTTTAAAEQRAEVVARQFARVQTLGRLAHIEIATETRRVAVSEFAAELLGTAYSPSSRLTLDNFYRQIHRDDEGSVRSALERVIAYTDPNASGTASAEPSCSMDCRWEKDATFRWVHINAVATESGTVAAAVQDITERKEAELALEQTKAKLLATWRLAKVAEWTYEIDRGMIVFHGSMKHFLGVESPIKTIPFDTFLATIREEDRPLARNAVEHTLRHGTAGEIVYEEKFFDGVVLLLFTRWVPERDEAGKIIRLRGLSIDISRARELSDRQDMKVRIHDKSGVPERHMAFDRLHYFSERAKRTGQPTGSVAVAVHNYRELKQHMADDGLYYSTQAAIAHRVMDSIEGADTFARFDRGQVILVLSRAATEDDSQRVQAIVQEVWSEALSRSASTLMAAVTTDGSVANCPEHGTEWRSLVALHEQRFKDESKRRAAE